jgi:hypothetical protein
MSVLDAYLEAALWSSTGDDDRPLDDQFSSSDFSAAAERQAERELEAFMYEVGNAVEGLRAEDREGLDFDADDIGHDFWLNRNGHGSGFWSHPEKYGPLARVFSELARSAGERSIYVDTDGELRFSPDPDYRRAAGKLRLLGLRVEKEEHVTELKPCLYCRRELRHRQYVLESGERVLLPTKHNRPDGSPCPNFPIKPWASR